MQVICIDDKPGLNKDFDGPIPKYGERLTVSWEGVHYGVKSYSFIEYGDLYAYSASRFVPISDICETTFERNYSTETV